VNPALVGAVRVPDAAIDPFRLTSANVLDARLHGAEVLTYHTVEELLREQNRIVGLVVRDTTSGQRREVRSRVIVNAAGIWGYEIARKAGVEIDMYP
jgi:glycerol-3-phosphate dehydrogenase